MVDLEQISKRFRNHLAVDNFDLTVPEGSLFGFIGPNGSGKTTTLRMILNIIEPDSGSIRIFGQPNKVSANNAIGYMPEERGLYRKMTVLRQLMYFGNLKGLSNREAKMSAMEWLDRLSLGDWKDKKLETLSKGMSQKIQFISTVIARPRLLILDEPFSGLDPVNLEVLRDAMLELCRSGTTVIFSTHDMHTAERLCDHLCMIYRGRKVLDGSLDEIQATYGQDTLRMRFQDKIDLSEAPFPGVTQARQTGRFWEMRFSGDAHEVLRHAMELGRVDHFEMIRPSLHDIFVRIAQPREEDLEPLSTEVDHA